MLLEIFDWGDLYTPAFLRKSVEALDCKRVMKHSWCKERQKSEKEREGLVPQWEKWDTRRGKTELGEAGDDHSRPMIAWEC